MNPVVATALAALPAGSETPRTNSYEIPEAFDVNGDSIRFRVHIRTNTPNYTAGWLNPTVRQRWESDCESLLQEIGFEKLGGWFYPAGGSRNEYLHTHPDDISGVTTLANVRKLHAAIARGDFGFSNRWIDVYEVYEDLSATELSRRLAHYETAIRNQLLDALKTNRKYQFKAIRGEVLATTLPGLSLLSEKAIGGYRSGFDTAMETVRAFVDAVQEQLVNEGWLFIFQKDGEHLYRTANKTEQRAMKLKRAS